MREKCGFCFIFEKSDDDYRSCYKEEHAFQNAEKKRTCEMIDADKESTKQY